MKGWKRPIVVALFLFQYSILTAQNCIPTNINGTVIDVACPQTCTNLLFKIPHIKGTDDYRVVPVPYTPYPYVTATGTEITSIYIDDLYSTPINLPFSFCFYGALYNTCVVGSNGLLSFDASNAGLRNSWSLTTVPNGNIPQPIPYGGGSQNDLATTYYPRAAVMGAYQDIYPVLSTAPARKIEYSVVGAAPCRKFIASFFAVPMYSTPCNTLLCTQQIVLNESTGIIDVYIQDKNLCPDWNEGLAILGVQNWARDKAVTAPGKNCTQWSESNTGYRFIPSGPGSRYVKSEIYTMSGTYVATADTSTSTPGLLDLKFLNFCPPLGSTQYEVRTTFSSCSNPAIQLVSYDVITINRSNALNSTATTTNADCGPGNGTITVTVPPGRGTPPFTYTLDGGLSFTGGNSHTFINVSYGPHTVDVVDASPVCTSTLNVTVNRNNSLLTAINTTTASCASVYNGTIKVTALNGIGPYLFKLDGYPALPGPNPNTFTNVNGGSHIVVVYDATGCQTNVIAVNVPTGVGADATTTTAAATCTTAANGKITVTTTSGVAPFTFQLDGGLPQSGTSPYTFNGVLSGPHMITVSDNVGCAKTISVTVNAGPAVTAVNTTTATSCLGATNGSIKVTPANGLPPYTYSIDGGTPVAGTAPYTFTNISGGSHTIQVFDAIGCISAIYTVPVANGPAIVTTAAKTNVLCNGGATGTITVNQPALGVPPYQYSLDGVVWQASRVFTGLIAGNYTVYFRSANGCQGTTPITITEPAVLNASSSIVPVRCNGESNGIITINPTGGTSPYQLSIDGGANWQSSNTFNVMAGNYTITIKDANNCVTTKAINVTEPATLIAFSNNLNATCDGGNDGRIVVAASGGNAGYQYSIDGVNYQSSNAFNVGPGNYSVFVKDNLGCATSFTTTVGLTFNLFLVPLADPFICEGTSTRLQTNSNATIYTWTPVIALDDPTISNPVVNPVVTTEYRLKAILGRCTLYDTVIVHVNKAPVPDAGPDGDICYGKSYILQGNGGDQYTWTPAIYLNTNMGRNPVSTPTMTTTYTLSVIDPIGCKSLTTDEVKVIVKRTMRVTTYPYDTIAHPGDQFHLMATSPGINYTWSPGGGLSTTIGPSPIVTVGAMGDDITYEVVATNAEGCKAEGYVRIRVYKGPDIYVPTGFTPNGDGMNDRFIPVPVGIKSYNYFRIFNRWGQMLFSTNKLNEGWDGKIGGKDEAPDVYVWIIEGVTKDNRLITKKGTITLIR